MKKNNKNCSEFAMSANWGRISARPPLPNPGSARDNIRTSIQKEYTKKETHTIITLHTTLDENVNDDNYKSFSINSTTQGRKCGQ